MLATPCSLAGAGQRALLPISLAQAVVGGQKPFMILGPTTSQLSSFGETPAQASLLTSPALSVTTVPQGQHRALEVLRVGESYLGS